MQKIPDIFFEWPPINIYFSDVTRDYAQFFKKMLDTLGYLVLSFSILMIHSMVLILFSNQSLYTKNIK